MITAVNQLEEIPRFAEPHVLTIGNFDGIHLGHQAILNRVVACGTAARRPTAALTFTNHPSEILRPDSPIPLICPPQERYARLQELGISQVIALPFSAVLAELSTEAFLKQLQARLPIEQLILGHDATLGKGRTGNQSVVKQIAEACGFEVHYEPAFRVQGQVISSSLIREAVRAGRWAEAAQWLGRAYSLSGEIVPGLGQGRKLGFPTLNISVARLCLPPLGVYLVSLESEGESYRGIANLGIAPTLRQGRPPLLEVHLKQHPERAIQGWVTVTMEQFLRPEKKFESLDSLKAQISSDIAYL